MHVPLPHVFPPSAIRQSPTGRELDAIDFVAIAIPSLRSLRLSHIKRRRLIMPLVALVQKKSQRTRNFVLSSGAWHSLRSSPLLLQFRLRKSKCLSKNPPNKQSAYCFSPQLTAGEYHARSAYNSRSEYNFAKQNITHKKSTLKGVRFL